MSYTQTTILSTREPVYGARRVGQVLAVPTGRTDKVSAYLEPVISDDAVAANIDVIIEAYAVDSFRLPIGEPLDSDSIRLSEITSRGMRNFRLEANTPNIIAVVLRTVGANIDNHVAWRYQTASASGEEMLISNNDGATWSQDTNRKFAFSTYSLVEDVVDEDDQSAEIQAGEGVSATDNSSSDFSLAELTRTVVEGDTVVIDFGNIVVTIVVDQSGSMTWNDNENLRFDFLEQYIDDLESILPAGSEATYSIVKFHSRQIGDLDIALQTEESGSFIDGVRIVRKIGSAPTGPSDGIVVFEGFATSYEDQNLTSGTKYHYAVFTYDSSDNFSEPRTDWLVPQSPSAPPMGVAGLFLEETIVLSGGNDIGLRTVEVSWVNPSGFDYDSVTVVRRTDRYPESETDGTAVTHNPVPITPFIDFSGADDPVNGLTYYYSIFSIDSSTELKAYKSNVRQAQVTISVVDRTWELDETPTPPAGFDDTPPSNPVSIVSTTGNGELLLTWSAGDATTRRYRIFYDPLSYPKPQTESNGSRDFSGEMIYDGDDTSFVHQGLDNGQPHFYVITAMDKVANQSSGVQFSGTPASDATDTIPPRPVTNLSAEIINQTTARLFWELDITRVRSVEAYFDEIVRLTASITYVDSDPRRTSAELEFVEDSREINVYDEDGNETPDDTDNPVINQSTAIVFDQAPTDNSNSLPADVSMIPFTQILNNISKVTLTTHASLNVKDSSSNIVTEVITGTVRVNFLNPFGLEILDDPPQTVPRRTWSSACDVDNFPKYETEYVPGVFARSGESYMALVEVAWRGSVLQDQVDLFVRVLDKETGNASTRIQLPETGQDGFAVFRTTTVTDEVIDRIGEPTGETAQRNIIRITLPPQDNPGEYIVEVTGTYLGYSRTARLEVSFENPLNIDLKTKEFLANGVDVAEQQAFVYLGSFTDKDEEKTAVPDLTVTTWEITKISGGGPLARPLFSREEVPGTGVKSYTRGGISRNVFFGPGTDIEPPSGLTCTDGEIYQLKVTASAYGMSTEAYDSIELYPFEPSDNKRLFLRLAKNQVDELGVAYETSELAKTTTYADGFHESAWEIIAKPEDDIETGIRSGADFRTSLVQLGGLIPSLEDGTVISISAYPLSGEGNSNDVVITTDLSPSGKGATAKATVINGKASFSLKSNRLVFGEILDTPLNNEVGSQIYPSSQLLWESSPVVFAIRASVIIEINGKPAIFSGGGGSIESDALPAFLSLKEPLATTGAS